MGVAKKNHLPQDVHPFMFSPHLHLSTTIAVSLFGLEADGALSITKAASRYAVSKSTLHARIQGRQPRFKSDQFKQLLTPEEEDAFKNWVLQLYAWGWPAKIRNYCEQGRIILCWESIGNSISYIFIPICRLNTVAHLIKNDYSRRMKIYFSTGLSLFSPPKKCTKFMIKISTIWTKRGS